LKLILFHEIGACLSYPDSGNVNSTNASQSRRGCITSWNTALTPSELASNLIEGIDLDGTTPSTQYNASVMALGQVADKLRSAGLFDPSWPDVAFVVLTIQAVIMIGFLVALHYKAKSRDFLLLLGGMCAVAGLLFAGGSYFALYREQGMLSLLQTIPVQSGPKVVIAPGTWVLRMTLTGLILAALFTVSIGMIAFERCGRNLPNSQTTEPKKKQGESKGSGKKSVVPCTVFQFNALSNNSKV
jgi:hypothetical protein